MTQNKVIVVIPLYTTALSDNDLISLHRSITILGNHTFAVVCPQSLDLSPLDSVINKVTHTVIRFNDEFFKGVSGYNKLMLSGIFYEKFKDYEYMLICQTDVYVFKDELLKWCNKGYDYIGAPWLASERNFINKGLFVLRNFFKKKKKSTAHFFKVGNGGFSLRKVAKMYEITTEQTESIQHAQENKNPHSHHIEDIYFSLVAPTLTDMKIPDYKEAVGFSIDRKPHIGVKINGGKLPFACHGFNKPKVRAFWEPLIAKAEKEAL
ncbi:hypothetical protein GWA97_12140 [Flavobacterium sp. LaA7.5]|nr:hypothetical protein [Flavobacterium salilacus subsp. altitudinum]